VRLALLLFALLSGCAAFTFTEAECRGMNWQERGYRDGYGGHPPQDLRLARECGRFGVQVPESQYATGWRAGYDEWYRLIGSMGLD
jgi:Protein of unknown function (DUF2799)